MKIKALAPWFGTKRTLASAIIELLGPHKVYWEPFCGSMSVLLAKPPCEMETVNDLHRELINLARVLQDRELGVVLYDMLYRTLYAEEVFKDSKEKWTCAGPGNGQVDVYRAYNFFVSSWMGLNGVAGTDRYNCQFALRWSAGGGQGAKRWQSVINSIPAWHKRLQNVVIIQRNGFDVLGKIRDEEGTVIYCDPPYFKKSCKYVHDFTSNDHERLSESLKRFRNTRIVVSYYDHPMIEVLYGGWQKIYTKEQQSSLRNASKTKEAAKQDQKEVLLVNSEIEQKGLFNE